VSWSLSSFTVGVVQVRASQVRRGRDTGSYVDRGERREVRAWAARTVKRLRLRGTRVSLMTDRLEPARFDAPLAGSCNPRSP
jgi:hypothetical protein